MCGRYTLAPDEDELLEAFDGPELTFPYEPRYNIAPGQPAPVVAEDRRGRRLGLLTWGLVPSWRDEPGTGLINARAETVADKPSYREAFQRRRCLVPADGFYEWQQRGTAKTPHWIHPVQAGVLSFAGLWERWTRPGQDPRHTFTILTTTANADVRPIHHRMPVVITPQDRRTWLARETKERELQRMLAPPPDGTFQSHPVSTRVNTPAQDDPALIAPR